jgi:hypothetical protein
MNMSLLLPTGRVGAGTQTGSSPAITYILNVCLLLSHFYFYFIISYQDAIDRGLMHVLHKLAPIPG